MPTYDYACSNCGHHWEEVQRITADALDTCPNCHEKTAKRQISGGAGFILKGGGWYSDLYGSTGGKPKGESGGSSTSSASTSTTTTPSTSSDSSSGSSGSSSTAAPSAPAAPSTPSKPSGS